MTDKQGTMMPYEAKTTSVAGAWMVVLSGADWTNKPGTASFVWPEGVELKIPRAMVLMTPETFERLTKATATVYG